MSDNNIHSWSLRISVKDNFSGCTINLIRFSFVMTHIQSKLNNTQFELFKKSIFGHFLTMEDHAFSSNPVQYLMLRLVVQQVYDDK